MKSTPCRCLRLLVVVSHALDTCASYGQLVTLKKTVKHPLGPENNPKRNIGPSSNSRFTQLGYTVRSVRRRRQGGGGGAPVAARQAALRAAAAIATLSRRLYGLNQGLVHGSAHHVARGRVELRLLYSVASKQVSK